MTHTEAQSLTDPAWVVFIVLSCVLSDASDQKWLLEQLDLAKPTDTVATTTKVSSTGQKSRLPLSNPMTSSRIKITTARQPVRPPPAAKTITNKPTVTPHSLKPQGFISRFALNLIKQKRFDKVYIHMSRACRKYQDDPFALKDLTVDEQTLQDLLKNAMRCALCNKN